MSAPLTVRSVKSAFFSLLKIDSAGQAVRDALANGAQSVLTYASFRASPQAPGPMLVIRYGPVTGARELVRTFYPTIWLYDDGQKNWNRLNDLTSLIEPLYHTESIAYCDTRYATGIGEEITDPTVNRPCLPLRYQVRGRF